MQPNEIALVAQWLEPSAHNGLVGGSSPSRRTIFIMKKLPLLLIFPILLGCQSMAMSATLNKLTTASWYSSGRWTASGQRFDPNGLTVAHRTLPFGTKLKLTNPTNGRSIFATVNDRGPFVRGVGLDVTRGAAHQLDFIKKGKTKLNMQVVR